MRSVGMGLAIGMAMGVSMAAMPIAKPARTRAGTPDDRVGGESMSTGLILAKIAKTHPQRCHQQIGQRISGNDGLRGQ